jgi:hypothetical protein
VVAWQWRPTSRFCSTAGVLEQLDVLEGAGDAEASAIWCGGTSVMSRPSKNSLPEVGL